MDFLPVARGEYPLALCLLRITLTTGDLRVWIQNRGFSTLRPFSLRDVDPMSQMQINPHFFFFFFLDILFYSVAQVIGQAFRAGHMVEMLKRKCSACVSRCLQED